LYERIVDDLPCNNMNGIGDCIPIIWCPIGMSIDLCKLFFRKINFDLSIGVEIKESIRNPCFSKGYLDYVRGIFVGFYTAQAKGIVHVITRVG
jgi:hypothetical protein